MRKRMRSKKRKRGIQLQEYAAVRFPGKEKMGIQDYSVGFAEGLLRNWWLKSPSRAMIMFS